jgi:hypothetical protein
MGILEVEWREEDAKWECDCCHVSHPKKLAIHTKQGHPCNSVAPHVQYPFNINGLHHHQIEVK